jgi:predicted acylesterase/phospholipase RssA
MDKNFKEFKSKGLNMVINFFAKSGLHSGKPFLDWIDGLLKTKVSTQVSEIKMRDLPNRAIVYATTVGEGLLRFDSNGERKETSAAFATRCSMSIPGFFVAERIENKKVYDGGLGYNFPLRTFIADNANSLFIGLYLTSDIKKNGSLFRDLRDIVTDSDERQIVDQHLDKIVIIDPRPIKTTQFKLSEGDKDYLLQAGKVGALKFLAAHHKDLQIAKSEVEAAENDLAEKRKKLSVPGYPMI